MAAGVFVIQEADGERFEWTSDRRPLNGARGGARATPRGAWELELKQRMVRTDYPGSRTPSTQALGSSWEDFQISGRWDDRYNFAGYALEEWRRMLGVVDRSRICRVQFQQVVFDCQILKCQVQYQRDWDIRYTLTVLVHQTPSLFDPNRSPETVLTAAQVFDDVDLAVAAAQEEDKGAPRSLLVGTTATDNESNLAQLSSDRDQLGATLDGQELLPPEKPTDAFTRLATQFRQVRASAFNTILDLAELRSDTEMSVLTAMGVLDFETWTRGVRFTSRIAMSSALIGDLTATRRAEPDAKRLYRPSQGEHLHAIARRFYGTWEAWKLIADRNALTSFEMQGTELLIIPERAG
jgi:hypothetical protein